MYHVIWCLLIAFFLGPLADAQSVVQTTLLLEKKSKLEQLITERMENAIAVSLERGAFEVNVSVSLVEHRIPKKINKEGQDSVGRKDEILPEDLTMGLLNAEDLLKSYQAELEALKQAKASAERNVREDLFDIKEVNITVGLTDLLDDTYAKVFQTWLSKRVSQEFGRVGTAKVGKIKVKPKPKEEKIVEPKTWIEHARDFQSLLGSIILGLGILFGVLIYRLMRAKLTDEQRNYQLQMNGNQKFEGQLSERGHQESTEKKSEVALLSDLKNVKELMAKIVTLISKSDMNINAIIETWLDNGGDGLEKSACVLDTLLAASSMSQSEDDYIERLKGISIPDNFKSQLARTLMKMKETEMNKKIHFLESAYWDLLSFQTLGSKYLKTPFSYANAVEPDRIRDALLNQPLKVRAMALLSMPQSVLSMVLEKFTPEQRKEIFAGTLDVTKFDKKEIETISEAIKFQLQNSYQVPDVVVGLKLVPSLLAALKPLEEVRFLHQFAKNKANEIGEIRQSWATLTFFDEWNLESQKFFLGSCSTEDVECLAVVLDWARESILSAVSPRVREMVSDGLNSSTRQYTDEELNAGMGRLRERLLDMITRKELHLKDLYSISPVTATGSLAA